ncbi:MAG: HD domain-containing protein, partial [Vicinamibacterales bacterium]|nr:HD domain-containing protein [Vicinamibacterales bacterium]
MSSTSNSPSGYSLLFDRALTVAGLVHAQQTRKGTAVPYLTHPVHVAMILARHGYPEPMLIAAVLHDVLEDLEADSPRLQQALRET